MSLCAVYIVGTDQLGVAEGSTTTILPCKEKQNRKVNQKSVQGFSSSLGIGYFSFWKSFINHNNTKLKCITQCLQIIYVKGPDKKYCVGSKLKSVKIIVKMKLNIRLIK